jgi:hypothetical protein
VKRRNGEWSGWDMLLGRRFVRKGGRICISIKKNPVVNKNMYEENGLHIFCNKSLNKKKSREDLFYFMI